MAVSLNKVWKRFVKLGEARYAPATPSTKGITRQQKLAQQFYEALEAEEEDRPREPEGGIELLTPITFTFEDGRSAAGQLCIGYFDNEDGKSGHIGVEVQMDTLVDAGADSTLIDIMSGAEGGWTKDEIVRTFNLDPDSPIWEEEELG